MRKCKLLERVPLVATLPSLLAQSQLELPNNEQRMEATGGSNLPSHVNKPFLL